MIATDGTDLFNALDMLRLDANRSLHMDRKVEWGQFFTPALIAQMMASMLDCPRSEISILDAGAGAGSLFCAAVEGLCQRQNRPARIRVTAYEIDKDLAPYLADALRLCRQECEKAGIEFTGEVLPTDFIRDAVETLTGNLFSSPPRSQFDCAILNPPYRKIRTDSESRLLLRQIGIETSNLYTGFLATAIRLLEPQGELIAITPRSFCNGPYFKSFRRYFLQAMSLRHIHLFESREQAFRHDNVLQENIILSAIKGSHTPDKVIVTTSAGPKDERTTFHEVAYDQVVYPNDPHSFIHIVPSASGRHVARQMTSFQSTLNDLGLCVSTGRVVDFRARKFLRPQPEPGTVPLIYPTHFSQGYVDWPKAKTRKPNALLSSEQTAMLLVPNEHYVLVKRFTTKEEKKRIVAALYDPGRVPGDAVGFENHLNYFHSRGRGLEPALARGLVAFLNSTLLDTYFRQFNGHTQVNATDLRSIKYPTLRQLEQLGRNMGNGLSDQREIDRAIEQECLI